MPKVNPEQYADKLINRLSGAGEDIRRGVEQTEVSPTAEAAKKKDKYLQGIQESVANGKWERGLMSVSREDWQKSMIEKGLPRIASGISNARPKLVEFAEKLLPHVSKGQDRIKNMPDLTLSDSKQRMIAWVDHMAGFKK